MTNHYWTGDSWGSAYPPENWQDLVDAANELIDAYAAENPDASDDELWEYSQKLWETYCSTDSVGDYASEWPMDKVYGDEPTKLRLTEKAQRAYEATDPLKIIEHGDGTYSTRGGWEVDNVTDDELIAILEADADEMDETEEEDDE